MPRGIQGARCTGTSRQSGEPCKRSAAPFSDPPRCLHHGGAHPANVERARAYYEQYAARKVEPEDPDNLRALKTGAFERAEQRRVRRDMAKKGVLADYDRQHGGPPAVGGGAATFDHWSEERREKARSGEPPPPAVRAASRAVSKVDPDPGPRTRTGSPPGNPHRPGRTPPPTPPPEAEPRPGSKPPGSGPGSREVLPTGAVLQPEAYTESLEEFEADQPAQRGAYYPSGSPDWADLIYG